ncbi:uncharacterized protein [Cherax quadricarinatus]
MAVKVLIILGLLMVMIVRGSILKCETPGRFPHPEDCGSYVHCIPGVDGQLTARVKHCFGFPYSPNERRCVSHDQQPGCTTIGLKDKVPVPVLQFLCEEGKPNAGCYNCKTAYECINGIPYVDICADTEACTDNINFGGGACLPYLLVEVYGSCECENTGLMADSYNETFYIYCDVTTDHTTMDLYQCDNGKLFSSTSLTCEEPQPPVVPDIPPCDGSTDTRVNPNDCSYSYTCLPDNSTRVSQCGSNEYFDQDLDSCESACSFVTTTLSRAEKCSQVGYNPDPTDCTKYYVCLTQYAEPYKHETCPLGYFDPSEKICVTGPLPNDCIPFDYSQCPGYDKLMC